ncbi:MAG: DUF2851 family protein [Flammeovirgaceae bacterium]
MVLDEKILSYIWQYQVFEHQNLKTTEGHLIKVLHVGTKNHHSGADFSQSSLIINGLEWFGDIEIHVKSSDWFLHQHHKNKAYNSVILHVVWENDKNALRTDNTFIPTLELKKIVDYQIIEKWNNLELSTSSIPCASQWEKVESLYKHSMLDKMLLQRLERKSSKIRALLHQTNNDWEKTAYQWFVRHFGFKVNNEAFEQLANSVPLKAIQHHADQILQLEALLFGQSGLLPKRDEAEDSYIEAIYKEYRFLSHKFDIANKQMQRHQWKFAHLRPANFPTLRIAQLAAFLHQSPRFFSQFLFLNDLDELRKFFQVQVSSYWQHHYHFYKKTDQHTAKLGKQSIDSLIINVVIPLLAAYSTEKNESIFLERCIQFLEKMPAEINNTTKLWAEIGLKIKNAADAQASLELYQDYCQHKKCLDCQIGVRLMRE